MTATRRSSTPMPCPAQAECKRLTFGGKNRYPIWISNDRVAFQSDREGDLAIFWQSIDGGTAERLTTPEPGTSHVPNSWSAKADRFLFDVTKGSDVSLWTYSMRDRKATPFGDVHSSNPTNAVFSPDGRWVAYTSTERNRARNYVQPFPPSGVQHQLPVGPSGIALHPLWSPDEKELFYNPAPGQFAWVSVTTQPTFDLRESGDGTETVPNRSTHSAKAVRHHTRRQVHRSHRSRTNGVRQARTSADPRGPQLVRRVEKTRACSEIAIPFSAPRSPPRSRARSAAGASGIR